MKVGICKLKIHIPESQSLKDKRRVLKSLTSRLQKQFNISIAEVDDNDLWQVATVGIAFISNHRQTVDEVFVAMINMINHDYPTVEIIEKQLEIY